MRNNCHKRTYTSWYNMKTRCLNKRYHDYDNWGGRGIKVCDRWLKYDNFLEDMGERPCGKTLDRIDNDGDYTLENCTWSTPSEQLSNKRPCRARSNTGEKYISYRKGIDRFILKLPGNPRLSKTLFKTLKEAIEAKHNYGY